jgi:hypothetical protein
MASPGGRQEVSLPTGVLAGEGFVGAISKKLASRFRKARRQLGELRRQAALDFARVPGDVKTAEALVRSGHDPLHAAYLAAQNFTSLFAESVSPLPEFGPYRRVVGPAQDEYLPGGPPLSPLTLSYFTTWAFFDLRFGPDGETVGTCLLDVADLVEVDPFLAETVRRFQGSRMGVYEHGGVEGGPVRLKELVTGDGFTCHVPSGYRGQPGQLWYVRLCPPLPGLADYHVPHLHGQPPGALRPGEYLGVTNSFRSSLGSGGPGVWAITSSRTGLDPAAPAGGAPPNRPGRGRDAANGGPHHLPAGPGPGPRLGGAGSCLL